MTKASVHLWGRRVGSVSALSRQDFVFQYDPEFVESGLELSPLVMPVANRPYEFPCHHGTWFRGLPGLLADALPDTFGNHLIDIRQRRQNRKPSALDAIERLSYVGEHAMGALEFLPASDRQDVDPRVDAATLVELASEILTQRESPALALGGNTEAALGTLLHAGTSAGGARAKALVWLNEETGDLAWSDPGPGQNLQPWLLKFDGVRDNKDKELADATGQGNVEYAYHLMALATGIEMTPCRLLSDGSWRHFATRRFDRTPAGDKIHMHSLGGMAHFDPSAGVYGYEQAFDVMQRLNMPSSMIEQQFLRMCFNIVARNQDDHVKNIAFLMPASGQWRLSPAYDVTFAHNPQGAWTSVHQMSMNGKQDHFERDDFVACADSIGLEPESALTLLNRVVEVTSDWRTFAKEADVRESLAARIQAEHRLSLG